MNDKSERPAAIVLEKGSVFQGYTRGPRATVCAEIVFNTASTGYQEICTDPSYANQIVLFTTSHVGNVGVNTEDHESSHCHLRAIVVRELSSTCSSWKKEKSFLTFLEERNIPWIEGIDTRRLARLISKDGSQRACIMTDAIDVDLAIRLARAQDLHPCFQTACEKRSLCGSRGSPRILIYDFGIKESLLNSFKHLHCEIHIIPYHLSADEILAYNPDGIVLSNGPGDPQTWIGKIPDLKKLLFSGIPLLGICLGCQLIALAAGGNVKKMKWGHHGINYPVYDLEKKKVWITSQNHNFVVDKTTLPAEFVVTHLCLFDDSIQGIRARNFPVWGFQGHPEGSPGPHDGEELFKEFLQEMVLKNAVRSLN